MALQEGAGIQLHHKGLLPCQAPKESRGSYALRLYGDKYLICPLPMGENPGGPPREMAATHHGGPPHGRFGSHGAAARHELYYTLEMPPGAHTWQLGSLPPRLALQYYYDWGNFMGTGSPHSLFELQLPPV